MPTSGRELGRRENLKLAREYADAASELDALDDVVADTNALLNRTDTWPTAWDRQLAPFRSDLAGLEQLLAKRHGQGGAATAAALRSFRDQSLREIERWTAELAEGKISPEKALDRLYDARTRLAVLLESHAETVIEGYAKNEREADLMRKGMEAAQDGLNHKRRHACEASILGTVYPSYHFFSVATFNAGLNTGSAASAPPAAETAAPLATEAAAAAAFPVPAVRPVFELRRLYRWRHQNLGKKAFRLHRGLPREIRLHQKRTA